jgi:fructose-1,6-bisphosphatase/inositol monophosphatase family enzyme
MPTAPDLTAVTALVREVAEQVHLPLFGLAIEHEEKSPGELVSRVDRQAELLLTDGLRQIAPTIPVVGEEAAAEDVRLLGLLHSAEAVWLVDPLDGTAQFLAASPDHAIMVALVVHGETVAAVVHQPQHGRTYSAELGAGTWRDGHRLQRASADPGNLGGLRGAVLRRFMDEASLAVVDCHEPDFGDLTPNSTCAGVEYPRLVEGEADFLLFWRTLPWDHAPGALLLAEAGGAALRLDGRAYRPADNESGLLAAADRRTAEAVLSGLGLYRGGSR